MREKTKELMNLLRAKDGLIYAVTYEENELILEICQSIMNINSLPGSFRLSEDIYIYSAARGMYKADIANALNYNPSNVIKEVRNINQALQYIENFQFEEAKQSNNILQAINPNAVIEQNNIVSQSPIFIFKDLHMYFNDKIVVSKLREMKENYFEKNGKYCPIIVIAPTKSDIPCELEKVFTLFEFPLMTKEEIRNSIYAFVKKVYNHESPDVIQKNVDDIANACVGLTNREITRALAHSLAKNNKKCLSIQDIHEEKLQIVKKSGVIDFIAPKYTLDDLGGCNVFKTWIKKLKAALTPEAKKFGLPSPKGAMLVGVPGTSKTASAEIMASYLNLPLLSLDMSKIMGSFVGQSERTIANALRITNAIAPCVLLLDEAEKAIGGIQSSNSSDSGTLSRVMSQLLTFLQNNDNDVICIFTSNDVSQLPPELTRSGRIDAQFMFDLPTKSEREEILKIYKNKYNLELTDCVKDYIIENTENFTGAEIKNVCKDILANCFYRQYGHTEELSRIVSVEDAKRAIGFTVTVWKSSKEKIESFRKFAEDRYINASSPENDDNNKPKRKSLDTIPVLFSKPKK